MLEELGLISCMGQITWSWTVAASFTNATLLSLSQSSLISIATQQVAGMKGNRQLNDFTPEWETSCPSLRGLWAERAVQKPGSLYSRCYWPAWGPWTSYVTSLSLSFVMSPTCNKYLLAPREVFDLLRENYIEWNMFAINYPIFSFLIMSVSHGGDLLFLLHLDVLLRNQGGKESYWFS